MSLARRRGTSLAALSGLALALAVATAPARGHERDASDFRDAKALGISQAAIGRTVGDYSFRDPAGNPLALSRYRGRPLVVSLIYTSCSHTCPVITQTLARTVTAARAALGGESFGVVTVGFNTRVDTPVRMRAFQQAQGIDLPGWTFLSADETAIDGLAEDLGFVYFPSANGFDHLAQTTIIDGEGRVYRQIYGEDFAPPALIEPLKQLVFGKGASLASIAGVIDRVRLFCTIYDPASGRYRFDYSIFIILVVGGLSLGSLGVVLVREWRRNRREETSGTAKPRAV